MPCRQMKPSRVGDRAVGWNALVVSATSPSRGNSAACAWLGYGPASGVIQISPWHARRRGELDLGVRDPLDLERCGARAAADLEHLLGVPGYACTRFAGSVNSVIVRIWSSCALPAAEPVTVTLPVVEVVSVTVAPPSSVMGRLVAVVAK